MKNVYFLTIVIPTFNRAEKLRRCLSYLLPQVSSYKKDVHVYISDNASSDHTKSVVREYSDKYPDIISYYRQQQNIGPSPNYNHAVLNANSEYVYLLSDDDFIVPYFVFMVLDYIKQYPDICHFCFNGFIVNDYFDKAHLFNHYLTKEYITVYCTGGEMIRNYFDKISCISSNLFKRKIWVDASSKMKEDCPGYEWLSILLQGSIHKPCAYIHYPMFVCCLPAKQDYNSVWPLYYIKGFGQLFKYLDNEHSGIYKDWIYFQQVKEKLTMLQTMRIISHNKKFYHSKEGEMIKFIEMPGLRLYYKLLVYILPSWFVDKILSRVFALYYKVKGKLIK